MLTPLVWRNDLAVGRLVQPFARVGNDGESYWLVYPEARARVVKIKCFREWLLATLGDSAA